MLQQHCNFSQFPLSSSFKTVSQLYVYTTFQQKVYKAVNREY